MVENGDEGQEKCNHNQNNNNGGVYSILNLTQLIERVIEPFGRYQILILFVLCINFVIASAQETLSVFYVYTPNNFTCAEPSEGPVAQGCVPGCKNYIFHDAETSVVTEWSLICDRRYLSALMNTLYYIGVTMGSLICGILADLWGRKKLILGCLYAQGVFSALICTSPTLEIFIFLRFIQGFLVEGLSNVGYTLIQEMTPPRHLTLSALCTDTFWSMGLMFLGIVAYFIRDWRMLQLYLILPTVATLLWFWLIPESPKWNLTKDKKETALDTVIKIARNNKDNAILKECTNVKKCCQLKTATLIDGKEEIPAKPANITDLFKNRILRKHILVMAIVWFSMTLSYYGVLLYMPNLPGGRHFNFISGAFIEILSFIVALYTFSSRLGRRYSLIIYQYLNATFCFTLGILTFAPVNQTWRSYTIITIAILGKAIAASGSGGMYIYGTELFPTATRASAIGLCGFFSRVGSFVAPQIILLGETTHPIVPMMIMSSCLFIGGTATFLTPETLNKHLPNTMHDVDETWG